MIKLVFLGTAGSTPTKARSLSSVSLEYNGEVFLLDCGEGAQRQMMQYSVNISRVKAVFLSHIHGDHTIGIAGLVRTLALNKRTEPLYIFIPKGNEKPIQDLIGFDRALINYRIVLKPITPGIIYTGKNYTISAFKLVHTINTYGFSFKENDKTKFSKQKVKSIGIKGTTFQTLLKKKSAVINGKTVRLKDVTTIEHGKKVVYATDTRPAPETIKASSNADVLIHEATYAESESRLAKERYHSTSLEGAVIAKKAKARRLILTHVSARYKDTSALLKDAKSVFKNTEMAKDGMAIIL